MAQPRRTLPLSPLYFPQVRRPRPLLRGLRLVLAVIGALALLTVLTGFAGALLTGSLQRVWNLHQQIEPVRVLDRSGRDLGVIDHCDALVAAQAGGNPVRCRETLTLPLSEMPRSFLLAYIAKEDVRYFSHPGIDVGRLPTALLSGAGGSTITMQLLKNNVLAGHFDYDTQRRGLSRAVSGVVRKATEYVLAPLLSARYSKAEVLEMSVNSLPWLGIGQRKGLHDAARIIFGVRADQLTLAQSAFLVGLLPRPSTYLVMDSTPLDVATEKFRWMRQQQLLTLGLLRNHALISETEYQQAAAEPLQPGLWQVSYQGSGPDLTVINARRSPNYRSDPDPAWSLQPLIKRELQLSGISPARAATVTLSIDAIAQQRLSEQVSALKLPGIGQGAAVVDSGGGVVALSSATGGELSAQAQRQWAYVAQRPVASTVKPLLYSAAFGRARQPLTQLSTFTDTPTRYYGQDINNNSRTFLQRPVSIREANARSLNTVAVKVGLQNEDALAAVLSAVGYTQDVNNRASPALGTYRASPLMVAAAYASFGNGGLICRPHLLIAVYDAAGKRIALPARTCTRLWDERVAAQSFDMLTGALSSPASHVKFLRPSLWQGEGVPLGAKSGTTDDVRDSWCAGVTPQYAMGVWLGDPSGVAALPTQIYEHQNACRQLNLLRTLPYTTSHVAQPAGMRRLNGALVPAPGVTLLNPTPRSP